MTKNTQITAMLIHLNDNNIIIFVTTHTYTTNGRYCFLEEFILQYVKFILTLHKYDQIIILRIMTRLSDSNDAHQFAIYILCECNSQLYNSFRSLCHNTLNYNPQ